MEGWRFNGNERKYLEEVLETGQMCARSGGMAIRFERAFAERLGSKYAIAVNSGTSSLHAALLAGGVGKGHEVIVPSLTVIMTAAAVIHAGAVPVFADIDPDTFCISPDSIRERITERTRAILPVPLFGLSCDMTRIMQIAEEHDLLVVEDCAQALGATFGGRYAGTWGHVGSFSFEQSKHICTGDGGMLVTDHEDLARAMRQYSDHGVTCVTAQDGRWKGIPYTEVIGYNYRLPEICAALGLAQLERIEAILDSRRSIAHLYRDQIQGVHWLRTQDAQGDDTHAYYVFPVLFLEKRAPIPREVFRRILTDQKVACKWHPWDKLAYMEPVFTREQLPSYMDYALAEMNYRAGICPVAESIHPNLFVFSVLHPDQSGAARQAEALGRAVRVAEEGAWN